MAHKIAVLGTGDAATPEDQVPEPIMAAASSGFRPELVPVPGAVFPATPAARDVAAQAYVSAGQKSARVFDALYVNTMGDYGLEQLREQVQVPVTGSGEAALRIAQSLGHSFAIVTIWPPSLAFIYQHVLESTGAVDQCVNIQFLSEDEDLNSLNEPVNFVTEMKACNASSLNHIMDACRHALDDRGADSVVLGCTCMQPVAAILRQEGITVVEPMVAGYRFTELLAAPQAH